MIIRYIACFSLLAFFIAGCSETEKDIPAPKIYMNDVDGVIELEVNDTLVIEPKIVYDYNSSYRWSEDGKVFSNQKNLTLIPKQYEVRNLTFEVETPTGKDSKDVRVEVIVLSDFESYDLKTNTILYDSGDNGFFTEKIIKYPNKPDAERRKWSGFAVSNRTQVSTSDTTSIYHVNSSQGGAKSKTFGIFYYQSGVDNRITFTDGAIHDLKSIDVCNNLFTAQAVKFGFPTMDILKFEKDDWLSVQIIGFDSSDNIVDVKEEVLADYRFENPAKYSILSTWKTIDLSDIKGVVYVEIVVKSSRNNVPKYVCVDNLKLFN